MRLPGSGKGLIGVDIASATVKLLELKQLYNGYQVQSYAVRPIKEGAVVERRIKDINDVARVLENAVDHAQPTTRKAAVAVPASAAITRTLNLPVALGEDEIEARIIDEYDRHVPFPFNEVVFDFQQLGPLPDDPSQQQVILVACRQRDVTQRTDTLIQAGLEPAAVDVESFAVERAFGELKRQLIGARDNPAASVALVDLGAHMNAFHVLTHGRITYSRDAVYGGRQLTDAIREHYGLTDEQAGLAKKRGGLPEDYDERVLTPFVDTIAQQIGRALQLYYTAGRTRRVEQLVLAGGSSVIPGLAERLAEENGLSVTQANPFHGMKIHRRLDLEGLTRDAPAMLTACGLAMKVSQ